MVKNSTDRSSLPTFDDTKILKFPLLIDPT